MKSLFNRLDAKRFFKSLIASILTIFVELLSVTFVVQIIASFYQVAIEHQLNVFDLTILSTFTGAVCGVIISKFASVYRFFRKVLDRKKGEVDDK